MVECSASKRSWSSASLRPSLPFLVASATKTIFFRLTLFSARSCSLLSLSFSIFLFLFLFLFSSLCCSPLYSSVFSLFSSLSFCLRFFLSFFLYLFISFMSSSTTFLSFNFRFLRKLIVFSPKTQFSQVSSSLSFSENKTQKKAQKIDSLCRKTHTYTQKHMYICTHKHTHNRNYRLAFD